MARTALITGGARGIGYGIAECLAADGVTPVIMDVHPPDAVAPRIAELSQPGVVPLYCQGDVTKRDDRERTLAAIDETFGRLDVLVNNAGVAPRVRADILEADEESFERLLRINLQG